MPGPIVAAAGLTAGAGLLGASRSSRAARSASRAQQQAAEAGIAEQRRQFDAVQQLLAPFVEGGTDAFGGLLDFAGLNGAGAQQSAIAGVEQSPEMAALVAQSENALLQNASATGGIRGGNNQRALAELRPNVLSGLINQQYQRLGGLATMGQNSAAQVGAAGQAMAGNVANLYGQQGAAAAGGALGQAAAFNQGLGAIGQGAGMYLQAMQQAQNEPLFGGNSWGF